MSGGHGLISSSIGIPFVREMGCGSGRGGRVVDRNWGLRGGGKVLKFGVVLGLKVLKLCAVSQCGWWVEGGRGARRLSKTGCGVVGMFGPVCRVVGVSVACGASGLVGGGFVNGHVGVKRWFSGRKGFTVGIMYVIPTVTVRSVGLGRLGACDA